MGYTIETKKEEEQIQRTVSFFNFFIFGTITAFLVSASIKYLLPKALNMDMDVYRIPFICSGVIIFIYKCRGMTYLKTIIYSLFTGPAIFCASCLGWCSAVLLSPGKMNSNEFLLSDVSVWEIIRVFTLAGLLMGLFWGVLSSLFLWWESRSTKQSSLLSEITPDGNK